MMKTYLRQFTSFELLEMAEMAAKLDVTDKLKFKIYFRVDFTFLQVCRLLTRRRIWNMPVLTKDEYETISSNPDKQILIDLFKEVRARNYFTIANFDEKKI